MMTNRDHNITIRHHPPGGNENTCTEKTKNKKKGENEEHNRIAKTDTNTNMKTNTTMMSARKPRIQPRIKPHHQHHPKHVCQSKSQSSNHRSRIIQQPPQRISSSNNKQSSSSSSLPIPTTTCRHHRRRLTTPLLISIALCILIFYSIASIMSFNLLIFHHQQQDQQQDVESNEMLSIIPRHHYNPRLFHSSNRNTKSTTTGTSTSTSTSTSTTSTNSTGFVRYSQRYSNNRDVVKYGTIKNKNNHTRKTIVFQRKYSKIIYFLHIHKSAGTYFCQQAFKNQMSANYPMNCNVQENQRCCGIDIENGNYKSQIDYAQSSTFDVVASEKEMYDIMIPQYYDYVVSLRHSQSRYYSHWSHLKRTAIEIYNKRYRFELKIQRNNNILQQQQQSKLLSSFLAWLTLPLPWFSSSSSSPSTSTSTSTSTITKSMDMNKNTEQLEQRRRQEHEQEQQRFDGKDVMDDPGHYNLTIRDQNGAFHPVGNYTKWIFGQPDNYNVRMICGSRCIDVPKYQLTKELFNYTLERIWYNFSHIIFVEDMEESFNRFATAYGWNNDTNDSDSISSTATIRIQTAIQHQQHRDKTTATQTEKSSSSSLHGWDPYMSVLDDALYEFAKRKYECDSRTDDVANSNSNNNKNGTNSSFHLSTSVVSLPLASLPLSEKFKNQDLLDQYFREGHLRNCTNACCGVCSKW